MSFTWNSRPLRAFSPTWLARRALHRDGSPRADLALLLGSKGVQAPLVEVAVVQPVRFGAGKPKSRCVSIWLIRSGSIPILRANQTPRNSDRGLRPQLLHRCCSAGDVVADRRGAADHAGAGGWLGRADLIGTAIEQPRCAVTRTTMDTGSLVFATRARAADPKKTKLASFAMPLLLALVMVSLGMTRAQPAVAVPA